MQVLEGWLFLGNVQELGSRLTNAYMSAVSASCAQTVRSVLLTQPALAARALSGANMHDLTRGVPSDLFRTCLARVLCMAPGLRLTSVSQIFGLFVLELPGGGTYVEAGPS